MPLYNPINLNVKLQKKTGKHEKDRNSLRKIVIDTFMKEKAGHGGGEYTSRYKYIVETLTTGEKVYLTRPVPLNKGFDFIIHVEGLTFMNGRDNPRHQDITEDLERKKQTNLKAFNRLKNALEDVFLCEDPDDIYPKYAKELVFSDEGFSSELILKVVKWFFIEQDVRYWNWSGRKMFMEGMQTI